jgi:hypothetical protein
VALECTLFAQSDLGWIFGSVDGFLALWIKGRDKTLKVI